jgi:putative flippase GtrA
MAYQIKFPVPGGNAVNIVKLYENSLLRFLFIGFLGTILNIVIFYIVADYFGIDANAASIIAFCIAVTQNYVLNHLWSFKKYISYDLNLNSYLKYVSVNIFGLVANLIVLNLIMIEFQPSLKVIAQLCGILVGTIFNYILSRLYVFKWEDKPPELTDE